MGTRNAATSDFETIERLFRLENRFSHGMEPGRVALTSEVLTESEFEEMIADDHALIAVSEASGVVTGFLFGRHRASKADRWSTAVNRVIIELLFVDEGYRGHGHASALIEHAIGWAESLKASEIDVEALVRNTAALGLYRKSGFEDRQLLLTLRLGK